MKERTKLILVVGILIILSYFAGYTAGFGKGIDWAIGIGLNFVELDIDEEALKQGVFNYKQNINDCFKENEYASVYDYAWA